MKFVGKITEVKEVVTGEGVKGKWGKIGFEVTEIKDNYPDVAYFEMFKNGEYLKDATEFKYKVGDFVGVEFNFKCNEYTNKEKQPAKFYSLSAWKVFSEEVENTNIPPEPPEDSQDLPF